ncbi:MAG: hypothetical protein AAGJ82_15800, partial [Bacteroidota bacterium]
SIFPALAFDFNPAKQQRTDVYQQNRYGVWHIIGNVEELLDDGSSIGGSWHSLPSEATQVNQHQLPDPRVGFRLVMVKN